MVFWKAPHPIKSWKNYKDEEEPHTQWDDLFFDLIFVGVAYNVGHLLEHSGPSLSGFIDCMIIFNIASKYPSVIAVISSCTYIAIILTFTYACLLLKG